jgi:UDP-glucose 4-epimerase
MAKVKKVLVTGGAGYIGSHTCIALAEAGYEMVVFDNLSNSSLESLRRVESITGAAIGFVEGDVRDAHALNDLFESEQIDAVIHFAGLKAVGESVEVPLKYYDNNMHGTLTLCEVMRNHGCKRMIFSSSATVYGEPQSVPIREDSPLSPTNPYGRSKLMVEEILRDLHDSDREWKITLLRYFNPVGAHPSGLIGEDPRDTPNNLVPYITQTAIGKRKFLSVFGDDYDTPDGTGVRDYIHVLDLAEGHVKALEQMYRFEDVMTFNLGTGKGYSVLEMIGAFEAASGKSIPYQIVPRRSGDIATCYADSRSAKEILGWEATRDLAAMCRDAWCWQSKNPNGYITG